MLEIEEAKFGSDTGAVQRLDGEYLMECLTQNTAAKQQAISHVLERLKECAAVGMRMLASCSGNLARLMAMQTQLAARSQIVYSWLDVPGK